jgi:hypothetical protein
MSVGLMRSRVVLVMAVCWVPFNQRVIWLTVVEVSFQAILMRVQVFRAIAELLEPIWAELALYTWMVRSVFIFSSKAGAPSPVVVATKIVASTFGAPVT